MPPTDRRLNAIILATLMIVSSPGCGHPRHPGVRTHWSASGCRAGLRMIPRRPRRSGNSRAPRAESFLHLPASPWSRTRADLRSEPEGHRGRGPVVHPGYEGPQGSCLVDKWRREYLAEESSTGMSSSSPDPPARARSAATSGFTAGTRPTGPSDASRDRRAGRRDHDRLAPVKRSRFTGVDGATKSGEPGP